MGLHTAPHNDGQVAGQTITEHLGDSPLPALVEGATRGEHAAWNQLFASFEPLIRSICRRYRVSTPDADDISQAVWLELLVHVGDLREPRALPGWIATTTSHKCLREVELRRRSVLVDPLDTKHTERGGWQPTYQPSTDGDLDEGLLREECRRAVHEDLAGLSTKERGLLLRLMADPPLPYAEVSRELDMPIGSIGPTRARCLKKLRDGSAISALTEPSAAESSIAA